MKKTLFLVVMTFLAFFAAAQATRQLPLPQHYRSNHDAEPIENHIKACALTVSHTQAFWLYVDNVLQNEHAVQSIRVERVPSGNHNIRVELDDKDYNSVGKNVYLNEDALYLVDQRVNLLGLIKRAGRVAPQITVSLTLSQDDPYGLQGRHARGGLVPCLNEADFKQAVDVLQKERYDKARLNIAKQIASDNCMSVQQIREFCLLFTADKYRLEFAKHAYPYCLDANKYYLLNDVMQYKASKEELVRFVADYK